MNYTPEQIRAAIVVHAEQCESALRCAATAAESHQSAGMVDGFQKLAAYESAEAFAWASHLEAQGGAA